MLPITKVQTSNVLPDGNSNFLVADIKPSVSPAIFRIYFCSTVTGILMVRRTSFYGGTTTELLNAGAALVAGAAYMFDIVVGDDESINIWYSAPGVPTIANGTGTLTGGSPQNLGIAGSGGSQTINTVAVNGAGNFTVTLPAGCIGTATSGTATVVGSPKALIAGANTVDTGITTGTIILKFNGGLYTKLQIDEAWN